MFFAVFPAIVILRAANQAIFAEVAGYYALNFRVPLDSPLFQICRRFLILPSEVLMLVPEDLGAEVFLHLVCLCFVVLSWFLFFPLSRGRP